MVPEPCLVQGLGVDGIHRTCRAQTIIVKETEDESDRSAVLIKMRGRVNLGERCGPPRGSRSRMHLGFVHMQARDAAVL